MANDSKEGRSPAAGGALSDFPFYEEGKVPQYHKYHSNVSSSTRSN